MDQEAREPGLEEAIPGYPGAWCGGLQQAVPLVNATQSEKRRVGRVVQRASRFSGAVAA